MAWGEQAHMPDTWTGEEPRRPQVDERQPEQGGGVTFDDVYALDTYPMDLGSLGGRITARAEAGYTPVGINFYGGQAHVLYLGSGVMPISEWQIDIHTDTNQLQQGINTRMNEGYLPNGLAWQDGSYYVLFVKTDFTGTAWQIVTSALDLQAVQRDMGPWLEQDYVPFGVTLAGGQYLTLLVQLPEELAQRWSLEGTQTEGMQSLIEQQLLQGFFPWGLLVDSVANVLFLGLGG